MSEYKLKTSKLGEKIVGACKKVEGTVVGGYKKVEDAFVETFLEKVDQEPGNPKPAADPASEE